MPDTQISNRLARSSRLFATRILLVFAFLLLTMTAVAQPQASRSSQAGATCTITATNTVNRRSGAGTTFPTVGPLAAGSTATGVGQSTDAAGFKWWQLSDGSFVRSDVVTASAGCNSLSSPSSSGSPTQSPAATQPPAVAQPPVAEGTAFASPSGAFSFSLPQSYVLESISIDGFIDPIAFGSSQANEQLLVTAFTTGTGGLNYQGGVAGLITELDPSLYAGQDIDIFTGAFLGAMLSIFQGTNMIVTQPPQAHTFGGQYVGQLAELNLGALALMHTDNHLLLAILLGDNVVADHATISNIIESIRIPAENGSPIPAAAPAAALPTAAQPPSQGTSGAAVPGAKWQFTVTNISQASQLRTLFGDTAQPQSGFTFLVVSITVHNELTSITLPEGDMVVNGQRFFSGSHVPESAFSLSKLAVMSGSGTRFTLAGIGVGANASEYLVAGNLTDFSPAFDTEDMDFTLVFAVPNNLVNSTLQIQFEDFPLVTLAEGAVSPQPIEAVATESLAVEATPATQPDAAATTESGATTIKGVVTYEGAPLANADVVAVPYEQRSYNSQQNDFITLAVEIGATRESAENALATMGMVYGTSQFNDLSVQRTTTNADGEFSLSVPSGSYTLGAVASLESLGSCASINSPLVQVNGEVKIVHNIVFPARADFVAAGSNFQMNSDRLYLCN